MFRFDSLDGGQQASGRVPASPVELAFSRPIHPSPEEEIGCSHCPPDDLCIACSVRATQNFRFTGVVFPLSEK